MTTNEKVDFKNINDSEEEVPIIIIEREEEEPQDKPKENKVYYTNNKRKQRTVLWVLVSVILTLITSLSAFFIYRYIKNQYIGVPISCTPEQNIQKLATKNSRKITPEVILTSDSLLGVAMNLYELRGLKAEISFEEPDTADTSVYLYSRCADHASSGEYLGSLVVNGTELQSDNTRKGYCAMANDNFVIGIAKTEEVKDYTIQQQGSFFRQFILVSKGVIPSVFHLHGKIERRGLGRINDTYYYIETKHAETLWDFADALRQYGFTDAIYVTGGADYNFYRTVDGQRHDINDINIYPHSEWKGIIPWLIFRKK